MAASGKGQAVDKGPEWEDAVRKDAGKLLKFVSLYCMKHHDHRARKAFRFSGSRTPVVIESQDPLCADCTRLLRHAIVMRVLCPLDPKPKCRKCPQNCYRPQYKDAMERVMRYSGPRSLLSKFQGM